MRSVVKPLSRAAERLLIASLVYASIGHQEKTLLGDVLATMLDRGFAPQLPAGAHHFSAWIGRTGRSPVVERQPDGSRVRYVYRRHMREVIEECHGVVV